MNSPNEPANPYAVWGEGEGRNPGDSISVGWALQAGSRTLFSQYGVLLGGSLAVWLITFLSGLVLGGFSFIVQFFLSPMTLGMPFMFVRAARGERVEFTRAFEGFQRYGPLLLINLLYVVLTLVAMIPVWGLMLLLVFGVASASADAWPFFIVAAIVGLIFGLAYLYAYTRLSFAPFLILDHPPGQMYVTDALKESWRMTESDGVTLFFLALACAAINIAGVLLLFLPFLLFTLPLAMGAMGAAYAHIRRRTNNELVGFCAYCGYDMRTLHGAAVCPECGARASGPASAT